VETHECHQHETRLDGLREEQDVKRLRKPEGVAESGEANPAGRRCQRKRWCRVTVASRSLTRCRGRNLMRGPLDLGVFSDGGSGEKLAFAKEWPPSRMRPGRGSHSSSSAGPTAWEDVAEGNRSDRAAREDTAQDRVSTFSSERDTSRFKAKAGRIQPLRMHREPFEILRSRANHAKGVSGRVTW
jgi:hypothetical protein